MFVDGFARFDVVQGDLGIRTAFYRARQSVESLQVLR